LLILCFVGIFMCHYLCWCALFSIVMLGVSSQSDAHPQFHHDSGGVIDYRSDPMAWQMMWASPAQVSVKVVTSLPDVTAYRRSDLADCQVWLVGWGANGDVLAAMPQLGGRSDAYRVTNSLLHTTISNTTIPNTSLANTTGSDTARSNQISANHAAVSSELNVAIDLHRLMNQQVRQWRFVPRQTPARPALVRLWLAVDAATHRLQLCMTP
jgi:hypothetical protein